MVRRATQRGLAYSIVHLEKEKQEIDDIEANKHENKI